MKQHITDEQLLELKYILTSKEIYDEYWLYDLEKYGIDVDNMSHYDISEQFTIGKMIEIMNIGYMEFDIYDSTWLIGEDAINCYSSNIPRSDKKELCDALWDYFKCILIDECL